MKAGFQKVYLAAIGKVLWNIIHKSTHPHSARAGFRKVYLAGLTSNQNFLLDILYGYLHNVF